MLGGELVFCVAGVKPTIVCLRGGEKPVAEGFGAFGEIGSGFEFVAAEAISDCGAQRGEWKRRRLPSL